VEYLLSDLPEEGKSPRYIHEVKGEVRRNNGKGIRREFQSPEATGESSSPTPYRRKHNKRGMPSNGATRKPFLPVAETEKRGKQGKHRKQRHLTAR
jgi:hypothetical protein